MKCIKEIIITMFSAKDTRTFKNISKIIVWFKKQQVIEYIDSIVQVTIYIYSMKSNTT